MRAEDLMFWLDVLPGGGPSGSGGVLCRRHADSMVVPRGWTLDDRREPDLHLFRPPARVVPTTDDPSAGSSARRRRAARRRETAVDQPTQLDLTGELYRPAIEDVPDTAPASAPEPAPASERATGPAPASVDSDGAPGFDGPDDVSDTSPLASAVPARVVPARVVPAGVVPASAAPPDAMVIVGGTRSNAAHDGAADGDDAAGSTDRSAVDEPLEPWTPEFDEADDLDGLLAARSPLLARAFRTADRRR